MHEENRLGEAIMFANNRVLHARSSFTLSSADDERRLQGCYYSWDTVKSKARTLAIKLGRIQHDTFP